MKAAVYRSKEIRHFICVADDVLLYLPSEMRRLLKYLLPVIVTAVFWGCADHSVPHVSEIAVADICFDGSACHTDISASESGFCLPRQVSFGNTNRVQSTVRRTAGAQRMNLEFAKSGKVVNAGLRYVIQLQSVIAHSSLAEPSRKLLCLGKLII